MSSQLGLVRAAADQRQTRASFGIHAIPAAWSTSEVYCFGTLAVCRYT